MRRRGWPPDEPFELFNPEFEPPHTHSSVPRRPRNLVGTVALSRTPSNRAKNAQQNQWSILRIFSEIGLMQRRQIYLPPPMLTVPVQLLSFLSAALLSENTIAGNVEAGTRAGNFEAGAGSGVPSKKRLFVSPVKPSRTQVGGRSMLAPAFTLVLTTSVDPALKLACLKQQSPKMFHSTVFQACAKLSTLSAAVAVAAPPAVVSTTVSVSPAAVPVSVVPCSCAAGTAGALELLLLKKQSLFD